MDHVFAPQPHNKFQTSAIHLPQTPLQQAYQIGAAGGCGFSCPAYLYQEYVVESLDIDRLRLAVEIILENHDALRLQPSIQFSQIILGTTSRRAFEFTDLNSASVSEFKAQHKQITDLVKQSREQFHNFYVHVFAFDNRYYVSVLYKLSAFDAVSVALCQDYLSKLYQDPTYPLKPSYYGEYVSELLDLRGSTAYTKAKAFWSKKIPNMPPAPRLPYVEANFGKQVSQFERLTNTLSETSYQTIKALCIENGISLNALLFTIYCDVLRLWSEQKNFTINVMLGYRELRDDYCYEGIGNCSSTVLTESHFNNEPLIERARKAYIESLISLSFLGHTGVDVIRDYAEYHQLNPTNPIMPIVFTSGIGLDANRNGFLVPISDWQNTHCSLSTPQVLLDHQVFDDREGLTYNWDYVEKAFPPGLVKIMFDLYNRLLELLASKPEVLFSPSYINDYDFVYQNANHLSKGIQGKSRPLHESVYSAFSNYPHNLAIQSDEKTLSYAELRNLVNRTSIYLLENGVKPGDVVAVFCNKGWQQVLAVIAILSAGGVYLPLDKGNPKSRLEKIVARSDCRFLLSDEVVALEAVKTLIVSQALETQLINEAEFVIRHVTDPAYIIFTSGSTGEPKGVAISHQAAANTIDDVTKKFEISNKSKAIALSALNFDLSVYDIFGVLGAGGTLVYPVNTSYPDPNRWLEAVEKYQVTVWNSVPAYLQMAVTACRGRELSSLKTVMLSGDWVKKDLVQSIVRLVPGVDVIAMGGATEASIWSNYFFASSDTYDSIHVPYGYPLDNQSLHIYDENLEHCPIWKEGDLYIGGKGVGIGYVNDPERTNMAFMLHPQTQERIYKTGDRARYMPGGVIDFLGRKDFQIKIRGHRIELGEIDAAALAHPLVSSAVSFVCNKNQHNAFIVIAVVTNNNGDLQQILAKISADLPDYMAPKDILRIDSLPITKNGKVDREKLIANYSSAEQFPNTVMPPQTPEEAVIYEIWKLVLGRPSFSIDDSFFDIGGNSITAVNALVEMEKAFSKRYSIDVIFQNQSVRSLAKAIANNLAHNPCVKLKDGRLGNIILLPPVGGNLLCYENHLKHLKDFAIFGASLGQEQLAHLSDTATISDIADLLLYSITQHAELKSVILCGWSMGGSLAYHMAPRLEALGIKVQSVFMIDSYIGKPKAETLSDETLANLFFNDILGSQSNMPWLAESLAKHTSSELIAQRKELIPYYHQFVKNYRALSNSTATEKFNGHAHYYQAGAEKGNKFPALDSYLEHVDFASDGLTVFTECDHFSILELAFMDIGKRVRDSGTLCSYT